MENILLSVESHLLAISDALHQPDPRQQNLRKQVELTVQAADKLVAAKITGGVQTRTRPVNKNELESAQLKIAQLQAQLRDMQQQNVQLKRAEKPLNKRIDALERVVIKLNNEKVGLEETLAKMEAKKAPLAEGVEITPIQK
jgi:septal ring factor EnvC (AmiA/AmiB activator)